MADLPDAPLSREEDYLASIAGQNVEVPPCPRSRKEAYLDAIDTKMDGIEQDIEDLKNNPDVVDIVDTYADLQAYDKTKLTDNDIIRVLNDETHEGESTYYRYSTATQTWTYVGSAGSSGGGVKTLTTADYNYPTGGAADGVAVWTLDAGVYFASSDIKVYHSTTNAFTVSSGADYFLEVSIGNRGTRSFLWNNGANRYAGVTPSDGDPTDTAIYKAPSLVLLSRFTVNDLTSTSASYPLSANQGRILNDKIVAIEGQLAGVESALNIINNGGN